MVGRDTLRQVRALRRQTGREADAAADIIAKAWHRGWQGVDRRWVAASDAVVAAAIAAGGWPKPWDLARIPELRTALNATADTLTSLARDAAGTVIDSADKVVVAVLAAEALILASQWAAADRAAAAAAFTANLPPRLADLVAATTATRIAATLGPLAADTSSNLERLVVRGLPVRDPRDTAHQLLRVVRAAFDGGLSRAVTVAGTEVLDAHRAASLAFRSANPDAVTGWVWVCRLDVKACAACWAMHGTVHGSGEPGPHGHHRCRCVPLNLRFGDDLGALPDARSRFDALPEEDQVRIVGARRLALLRSGRVSFSDFAGRRDSRNWRPSYAPRSLTDLQRLARIRP